MKLWPLVAVALAAGCTSSHVAPPRAPSLSTPTDALPPDLDLVFRVDVEKVRSALGSDGFELMRHGTGILPSDPGTAFVADALAHTRTAWLAVRPELVPGEPDNVLVLVGQFDGLKLERALASEGWSGATDLGGDVRRYDRKQKVGRAAPARLYAFREQQLVFVSTAEVDSVEAVLERGLPPSRLAPREQGVVAFAARMRALRYGLGQRYPSLARSLGDASGFEGTLDATPEGLRLEVTFELSNEMSAQESAEQLGHVREALAGTEGKLGTVAQGARAEAVGRYVVVRVPLTRGLL
jgi:hypothetical protein